MEALLTAVVPIHQMEGKLQNLRSWLSNTHGIDVVLVHDGSIDATQIELDRIQHDFDLENLILISGNFGSPGISRNAGLEHVKTKFVTFWDSDDLPSPKRYLEMSYLLNTDSADVCIGEYEIVNVKQQGISVENISPSHINQQVAINPGVWRMVFRKSSIPTNPFTNLLLGEDHIFLQELNFASMKKSILKEKVYTYFYAGNGNLTSNKKFVPQLMQAFKQTNNFRKKAFSKTELEFSSIILLREAITMIKKGRLTLKIRVSLSLLKLYLTSSSRERSELSSALRKILDYKL